MICRWAITPNKRPQPKPTTPNPTDRHQQVPERPALKISARKTTVRAQANKRRTTHVFQKTILVFLFSFSIRACIGTFFCVSVLPYDLPWQDVYSQRLLTFVLAGQICTTIITLLAFWANMKICGMPLLHCDVDNCEPPFIYIFLFPPEKETRDLHVVLTQKRHW